MEVYRDENQGRVTVTAPYDNEFVATAKSIGGRWDFHKRAWIFDARNSDLVDNLLVARFGVTDGPVPTAAVEVTVPEDGLGNYGRVYFMGRLLAERPHRDRAVRLGAGVSLIEGDFALKGGSARDPRISGHPQLKLRVLDIPTVLVREGRGEFKFGTWAVIDPKPMPTPPAAPTTTEPTAAPEPTTSIAEGYAFGRKVAIALRKRGNRRIAKLAHRLFEVGEKNAGKGTIFYVSAAYSLVRGR